MKDFPLIKALVKESVREEELRDVDCYVQRKLGLFIPSTGPCGYAKRIYHTHPSYMFVIVFSAENRKRKADPAAERNYYSAIAVSPDLPHMDLEDGSHYYCVLIDKAYFEEQFRLYTERIPLFRWKEFSICRDILKALNTFAFEYSKNVPNSDITLDAQATIITHWIIRSLLDKNSDMRAVSSNYEVARAEQYIERHFGETITVGQLAELAGMSNSSFTRSFKKETGRTPIEYLIEVRIEKSKTLLRRKDVSIIEAAMRCGFRSSAYFSTCFARLTKVTPSEYRNSYRE